ncbi:hypothetical protein ACLB2K_020257 [Fragaria x ananassa]
MIGREVLSEIAAQTSDRDLSGLLLHSNTVGGGLRSCRGEETASSALKWWRNGGNPYGKFIMDGHSLNEKEEEGCSNKRKNNSMVWDRFVKVENVDVSMRKSGRAKCKYCPLFVKMKNVMRFVPHRVAPKM